jgi:crotonobetainyl-CoA:carnitine CoA-transferase CaiB-like acyl-CoA transferase
VGALDGMRVIDLSPNRVGAQISQLFADYGADVIWVEPPGGASLRRHPAFAFWARGKQSLELDLRDGRQCAVARDLAVSADVFIETFRPGVMEGKGLGYDDLAARNPRLVYTSVTGFGGLGPCADLKGYEGLVAAKLGVLQAFRRIAPGGAPPFVATPWCSFTASQVGLHGTLSALLERDRSGRGQHVETNLAQAFMALDTWSWFEHLVETKWPGAYTRARIFEDDGTPASPFVYLLLIALTADGHWLQFAQVAPRLFAALMKALDLDHLLTDPAWAGIPTLADRGQRFELWTLMLEAAKKKTLAEWQAIFDEDPNVFAEEFRAGAAILEHPQLLHDAMVVEVDDAEAGPVRQPAALVKLCATPADVSRSAPRLGQHDELAARPAPAPAADEAAGLPLEGVTIIELAALYAAPYGATLLTDLGARVIKVEPLEGDPIRVMMPFPETAGAKVMQGKESVCIDVTTTNGLAIVHQLVKRADVVLQGFRAGVAERLGLAYEQLRPLNPDLVYLNAPGYGVDGPHGHRPAYAPSIGAAAGIARTNVGPLVEERPDLDIDAIRQGGRVLSAAGTTTNAQADGFAAVGVATALLLGLVARGRGAGGQEMVTTMLNTNAHAMSAQAVAHAGAEEAEPDPELRGLSALYRVYDAADGWIFLAAPAPHEWDDLVTAVKPYVDLEGDARFATAQDRETNDGALAGVLAGVFARGQKHVWERELRAAGVGCVAVTTGTIESVLWSDEFGRASGYLADVVHPTFDEHPRLAPLVRFSRSATRAEPGVLAGSATDAVMRELGFDDPAIADLRTRNVIR